jgi:hypothetical protein
MLAFLLALVLSVANVMAAAMPPPIAATGESGAHPAMAPSSMHEHCARHETPSHATKHAAHGAESDCCAGKTCACVTVCDVPPLCTCAGHVPPPMRIFAISPPRTYAAIEARLLRPPIA